MTSSVDSALHYYVHHIDKVHTRVLSNFYLLVPKIIMYNSTVMLIIISFGSVQTWPCPITLNFTHYSQYYAHNCCNHATVQSYNFITFNDYIN